jgi:molecular chaperone DnaK
MIFTAEKAIKDGGDKIKPELKTEVEDKIKAVREILDTGSKEDLDSKTKDLMESMQKIGSAMYEQPKQEAGATESPEVPKDDKVKTEEGEVVG